VPVIGEPGADSAQGGIYMDSAFDSAYYENLAGRLYGLVIRLTDRLPPNQIRWLHHVVEVGEYGLALEDMAGMLAYHTIAITDEERQDMLALASQMNMKDLDLNRLGRADDK
jgi:hypothetical protein